MTTEQMKAKWLRNNKVTVVPVMAQLEGREVKPRRQPGASIVLAVSAVPFAYTNAGIASR